MVKDIQESQFQKTIWYFGTKVHKILFDNNQIQILSIKPFFLVLFDLQIAFLSNDVSPLFDYCKFLLSIFVVILVGFLVAFFPEM